MNRFAGIRKPHGPGYRSAQPQRGTGGWDDGGVTVDHWAEMIANLTGWDINGAELLKIGERVINL